MDFLAKLNTESVHITKGDTQSDVNYFNITEAMQIGYFVAKEEAKASLRSEDRKTWKAVAKQLKKALKELDEADLLP